MIGYTCKYTPLEIIKGFNENYTLLNEETNSFQWSESITHSNLCSHAKAILENCYNKNITELLLVNCCDSMRRVYDVLKSERTLDFLFLLDLPHSDSLCAQKLLKKELLRFIEEYSSYKGRSFNINEFLSAFNSISTSSSEPFIGIYGARLSKELFQSIKDISSINVKNFTCSDNRSLVAPSAHEDFDKLMDWYSKELLTQIPCMRMSNIGERRLLFEDPNLKGIIYHTVKFCDYYNFEYSSIKNKFKLPILKIESDFTPQAMGQLSTRITAFMETIENNTLSKKLNKTIKYVAGIDSGSTSTNVVILNGSGEICASAIARTGPKAEIGAKKAIDIALNSLNITINDIDYIVSTGYGRNTISFSNESLTEITCHAKGAYKINPNTKTIIDIGGQDSKVITLNEDGSIKSFVMNDKCAAGTGRFLEMMCKTLELTLDEMSKAGLNWKKDITISSMCTVFAESEVISLIADNNIDSDIIHGLNKSVASKTKSLIYRINGEPPYMMTGGVARNIGVVNALEKLLDEPIYKSNNPDLCGALGAALLALEKFL